VLENWVAAQGGLFSFEPPRAGGMAFLKYAMNVNSTELVHAIRREKSVLLVPGDVYGLDGYLRVGIGTEKATLEAGLARVGEFLRERNDFRDGGTP